MKRPLTKKSRTTKKQSTNRTVKRISDICADPVLHTLSDLVHLCDRYENRKNKDVINPFLERLSPVQTLLIELNDMIGLETIKTSFMQHVVFVIQGKYDDMLNHIVIYGGPGNGKTMLAKLMGNIFAGIRLVSNGRFITATRADLIGEHLGSTALKTAEVMSRSYGNILFIDEVYSLGSQDKRDSFSKECIDTINLFLTEYRDNMVCIVAGYEKDIEECFFGMNKGLERRFPWKYHIPPYTIGELKNVFIKQSRDLLYEFENVNDIDPLFVDKQLFPYHGGDTEVLLDRCRIEYSLRRFLSNTTTDNETEKIFTKTDLEHGFQSFLSMKKKKEKEYSMMYI